MTDLNGRRILLGVCGGIAAYKSAELLRLLCRQGAEVRVVMTSSATRFVTPLTFQALSGQPVAHDLFDDPMAHIELARWAEAIIVAPASATTLARLAHGLADDLLSAIVLAAQVPLALAPAMNQAMWRNPATAANVALLRQRGCLLLGPAEGEQACGETGPGRMLEAAELAEAVAGLLRPPLLARRAVLITAGPTREALDPVRFLSNRSSGKMGYALARAAARAGAKVTLVTGPVSLTPPPGVDCVQVESAAQMREAVLARVDACDIFIAAAAVADYRPAHRAAEKIKKNAAALQVELVRNADILAEVAGRSPRPFCVGFAAETENLADNAQAKLNAKRLDMIAANWVGPQAENEQTGFDSDHNALHVYTRDSDTLLRKSSKGRIAEQLIELIARHYHERYPAQDS